MKAVIDEDLPRSFASVLISSGFTPLDIRDSDLRGRSDKEVFDFACNKKAVLFSADKGFSNILSFPLGSHYGIVILRFPNGMSVEMINKSVKRQLQSLLQNDYKGNVFILSPGKIRIRRLKH